MPRDRNGVWHSGWAAVGEANRNRRHRGGVADKDYEKKAKSQGVDLTKTPYKKTSGYRYGNCRLNED
jgi:hypothetical protein